MKTFEVTIHADMLINVIVKAKDKEQATDKALAKAQKIIENKVNKINEVTATIEDDEAFCIEELIEAIKQ